MIPVSKAIEALSEFAAKDVVAVMPNGLQKFLAQMAVVSARANPENVLRPYEPFLKMIGVLSEDGQSVDEQALYNALMGTFREMPRVSFLNFTFTSADAERLMQRMVQ